MKLLYLSLLLIIMIMGSFTITPLESQPVFRTNYIDSDQGKSESFECDNFTTAALAGYTINLIEKNYAGILKRTIEPVTNLHDPDITDTIFTYSNSKNKIQIYKAKHGDFIFTFDVTDPLLRLNAGVGPGMTRNNFIHIFHISNSQSNNMNIVNSDGTVAFSFLFENNVLKHISGDLYID